jgi:hypothetical protein
MLDSAGWSRAGVRGRAADRRSHCFYPNHPARSFSEWCSWWLLLAGRRISSLVTNRGIVAELSDSFEDRIAREDLASAVTKLNLTLPGLTGEKGIIEFQGRQNFNQSLEDFDEQLAVIEKQLNDYKQKIDNLPSDPSRNAARQVTIAAFSIHSPSCRTSVSRVLSRKSC